MDKNDENSVQMLKQFETVLLCTRLQKQDILSNPLVAIVGLRSFVCGRLRDMDVKG